MTIYNIRLIIEYDGTGYHGWQRQKNLPTIQEALENVLSRIIKETTKVTGAGRTDAGVHATGQVATFRSHLRLTESSWIKAINSLLPRDIVIRNADYVPSDFSARHSAIGKIYQYVILNSDQPSPFLRNYVWHIKYPLDIASMRRASKYLIGTHDFSSFRASDCSAASPVRTLESIEISKGKKGEMRPPPLENVPDFLILTFYAKSFLQHMVRNIVGTLVAAGRKKINPSDVRDILEKRDRRHAGPIAPPQGLYLREVQFYI